MPFIRKALLLVSVNVLLLIACLVFASGFFPYKPFLPGLARYEPEVYGKPPAAPFNRVILMVVDALRSDFVFSADSGFDFTQRLIAQGSAWPFTAHAAAPTVTMPRVKAITTGSIPSFVDMILNVAESDTTSSLANQDTWLAQMKAKDSGKLVMYGDDTWLKLFPDTFARSDGTVSFFVSDFTEVDNNVTRHVPEELRNDDWNVMIMHYLGMDHIGHKSGPRSVNMKPKQREMDNVVREVYEALETQEHLQKTLLVLCGDHGMNDAGNHGGSAPGETSPALVFIAPRFKALQKNYICPVEPHEDFDYYDKVEQSDIAPTLAGLLGFPIPMNNLGIFISQFLSFWKNDDDKINILYGNAVQMLRIVKATFPHPWYGDELAHLDCTAPQSSGDILACSWKRVRDLHVAASSRTDALLEELTNQSSLLTSAWIQQFCQQAQSKLSSTASNYNLSRLYTGIALSTGIVLISFASSGLWRQPTISIGTWWLLLTATAYTLMMFASSYVEEEQQFWYWSASAWLTVLMLSRKSSRNVANISACLFLFRILRRWNQSGQKYAGADDIVIFLGKHASWSLWPLIIATFTDIGLDIGRTAFTPPISGPVSIILVIGSVIFKLAFTLHEEPELLQALPLPEVLHSLTLNALALIDLARLAQGVFAICAASFVIISVQGGQVRLGKAVRNKLAKLHGMATNSPEGKLYPSEAGSLTALKIDGRVDSPARMKQAGYHRNIHAYLRRILPICTIILVMQTRITNIAQFLFFNTMRRLLFDRPMLSSHSIALTTLFLAQSSYFFMGGTNAISSIDLSNAYNGVTSYNPIPVGILLFLGNWAGPIFWTLSGMVAALRHGISVSENDQTQQGRSTEELDSAFLTLFETSTFFMSVAVCSVMLACTALRAHLFVWTVFSPKFLYVAAWLGGWHLVIGGVFGLVLLTTGSLVYSPVGST